MPIPEYRVKMRFFRGAVMSILKTITLVSLAATYLVVCSLLTVAQAWNIVHRAGPPAVHAATGKQHEPQRVFLTQRRHVPLVKQIQVPDPPTAEIPPGPGSESYVSSAFVETEAVLWTSCPCTAGIRAPPSHTSFST